MKHDVSYNLFTAKDVAKILGINSNMLFHWVQTKGLLKPAIIGQGRGKKNFFNLEDLATLSIIKILNGHRIDLWRIKSIINRIINPNPTIIADVEVDEHSVIYCYDRGGVNLAHEDEPGPINVWQVYKKGKMLFDKKGLFLIVPGTFDGEGEGSAFISVNIYMPNSFDAIPEPISTVTIDILRVIKEIEKRTGLAL